MLLVVDVGNTQTHFGVIRTGESEVAEHWRFATVRESTGDELGAALSNLLALKGFAFTDVSDSIVSSTVPQLSEQWTVVAQRYLGHQMLVVGPTIRTRSPGRRKARAASQISSEAPLAARICAGETPSDSASAPRRASASRSGYRSRGTLATASRTPGDGP